jgi:hypothetical protein
MEDLRISDFNVGDSFALDVGGAVHALQVEEVQALPGAAREAGAFRLLFSGPPQPVLPQATYTFCGSRRSDEIFIVPIAADRAAARYEAIFA